MKMIIDGKKVDSLSGETFDVINPATGKVIESVPKATAEDIDLAHSGELGRIPFAQQDRLVTVFQEEGAVAHENLHGGEIVEITLRSGCDEFGEAVEHGDLSRRTYLFENRPQAQPDQDVGRNDGDGRFCRGTAHSWW